MAKKKPDDTPKPDGDKPPKVTPPDPAKEAEAKAKAEAEDAAKEAAEREAVARENAAFVQRSCELAEVRRHAFLRMKRDEEIHKDSKKAYELAVASEQGHKDRFAKPMPLFEDKPAKPRDAEPEPEPEPGFKTPIDDSFRPTVLASIGAIDQPWLIELAKSPPDVLTVGDLVKFIESGSSLAACPQIGTEGAKTIFTAIAAAQQQFLKGQKGGAEAEPFSHVFLSSMPEIEMPWVAALTSLGIQSTGDLENFFREGKHLRDIPEIGLKGAEAISDAVGKARKEFDKGQDAA